MHNKLRNNNNGANSIISHLAAEKKKTVMAICLISLMVFMWARVFFKKTTAVEAIEITKQMDQKRESKPALIITFMELPEVAGRNDVITRDFFASNGWDDFVIIDTLKTVGTTSRDIDFSFIVGIKKHHSIIKLCYKKLHGNV